MKTSRILLILLLLSCKTEQKNTELKTNASIDTVAQMLTSEIIFNGKLRRFFSMKDFQKVFGKADSTKLLQEEEPCTSIFGGENGIRNAQDKYLYKSGSRFENSKEKVAIDEFRFSSGNYITYRGIIFNANTTKEELSSYFSNTNIDTLDVYGEGKLQVISMKEDKSTLSNTRILLFLKKGKLYFMQWFNPC